MSSLSRHSEVSVKTITLLLCSTAVCMCVRAYVCACAVFYHHGLMHSKVRQQHVVLHDVAGDFPEGAKISGLTVDQDLAFHSRFPAHTATVKSN